jgi:hypothetical protein
MAIAEVDLQSQETLIARPRYVSAVLRDLATDVAAGAVLTGLSSQTACKLRVVTYRTEAMGIIGSAAGIAAAQIRAARGFITPRDY